MEVVSLLLLLSFTGTCFGACNNWGWDFYDNNDILGQDIRAVPSPDRNGCQTPCFQQATCVGYSWANGICYLKRGSNSITAINGVYSAVLCRNQPCTHWGWRFYDFTDMPGNDIGKVAASSRNGCQTPCQNTPGCIGYSWTNGICSLKSKAESFVDSSAVYSAIMCNATTKCGDNKIRGVNLGGWLVLEKWMTPTLFNAFNVGSIAGKVIDEWTVAQYVNQTFAQTKLRSHWDTFYQLSDLEMLYNSGISHLRIPVGFWMFDVQAGEPFPPPPATDNDGQRFYLKRLMKWADQLGLKVLVDLHGAPGSQNGQDHSGHTGPIDWLNNGNVARTISIIGKLAGLMEQWINEGSIRADTLYGIQPLNEPADSVWNTCKNSFYFDAYNKIRNNYFLSLPENKRPWVNVMSGFKPNSDFIGYMSEPNYRRVSLDQHLYQCFGDYWNQVARESNGWSTHLQKSCAYPKENPLSSLPTFTGEFSLSVVDCRVQDSTCAYYSRPFSAFSNEYKDFLRKFFLAQIDGFEYGPTGVGWFFWNAKLEDNDEVLTPWNYLFLLKNGIIPSNLCTRQKYCQF